MGKAIASAVAIALALVACGGARKGETSYASSSSWTSQQLLASSKEAATSAMAEKNRGKSKDLAERGMEMAKRCLMSAPEEPGCYYWRAVSTGLYYRVHVIGYQDGVKEMISDCEKVISIDARYENAGAYRMLGQLYTQLPETAGRPDSVTRDLDLAEENLRKAVQTAPGYPENHLALAEVLLAKQDVRGAIDELAHAKELTPRWRNDASYGEWRDAAEGLEQRIAKRGG